MSPFIIYPIVFTDPSVIRVHLRIFYLSILKCFFRRELFTRCEWLNIWRSLRSIGATVFPWDFARQYISVSPHNLTLLVMARRRRSSNVVQLSLQVGRSVQKLSVVKTPFLQPMIRGERELPFQSCSFFMNIVNVVHLVRVDQVVHLVHLVHVVQVVHWSRWATWLGWSMRPESAKKCKIGKEGDP